MIASTESRRKTLERQKSEEEAENISLVHPSDEGRGKGAAMMSEAMYIQEKPGVYVSQKAAQGAWNEHEQHMGPASGLLAHELEKFSPQPGLRLARIGYEILGLIPAGRIGIDVEVERPGRTISLLRATMSGEDGRPCIVARAWRLALGDTQAVAGSEEEPMPARGKLLESDPSHMWPGGYIAQLRAYQDPASRPGRGRTWVSSTVPLIEGQSAPLGEFIRDVDAANGMVPRVAPGPASMGGDGWMFPNVDLQIHLWREPAGEWNGLDTRVNFSGDGVGLTTSVLHDEQGPVGRVEQILTVRKI